MPIGVNYRYYLGPWLRRDGDELSGPAWIAPPGTVGLIDLRNREDQARATPGDAPYGFFAVTAPLGGEYALLGVGDCREIAATAAERDALQVQVAQLQAQVAPLEAKAAVLDRLKTIIHEIME